MGIKHFYIYLKNNFGQCINKTASEFKHKNIHNLCLDMNGIIHNCAQEVYEYGNFKKKRLLTQKNKLTLKNQLRLFNRICENVDEIRKSILPSKRIILCIDGVAGCGKMAQQRQRRFKSSLEFDKNEFNSNCISAGTQFMEYLSKYIDWYIRVKLNTDDDWKNLEVVFSNEQIEGEGEHKIINYIRKFGKESESFCIHGLDADLLMLGMSLSKNDIYILRDNINRFGNYDSHLIDISMLKKGIIKRIDWGESDQKFSGVKGINDFVFMCFLVGNDFLPNIPGLAILDGGIDSMVDVYKNVGKEYGHLLNSKRVIGNMLNIETLEKFLGTLAQYEKGLLEEKHKKLYQFIDDPLLKKHVHNNTLDFDNYKQEYYQTKLGISSEDELKEICISYIKGLDWVINYYKIGIPSWTWYYTRFYAPFLCDIVKYMSEYKCKWDKDNPLSPTEQLMCVLPKNSHYLLPSPYDTILYSKLPHYYPATFNIDCSGKRKEWEGIVIVSMVDIQDIIKFHKDNCSLIITKTPPITHKNYSYKYIHNTESKIFKSYYGNIHDFKVFRKAI
jgi:5'-3' exonuclease